MRLGTVHILNVFILYLGLKFVPQHLMRASGGVECGPTHSEILHQMEVSGQLQDTVGLLLVKKPVSPCIEGSVFPSARSLVVIYNFDVGVISSLQ
jgi:hypothetical protein